MITELRFLLPHHVSNLLITSSASIASQVEFILRVMTRLKDRYLKRYLGFVTQLVDGETRRS